MKMKVGDIVMDSEEGISFQGDDPSEDAEAPEAQGVTVDGVESEQASQLPTGRASTAPESPRPDTETGLHPAYRVAGLEFPEAPPAGYLGVGVLATTGFLAVAVLAGLGVLPLMALVVLPGLAATGIGGVTVYGRLRADGIAPLETPAAALERRRDSASVVDALEDAGEPLAVEELRHRLDWSEQRTVLALRQAVEQEAVAEDLDIDSGHWIYEPCRAARSTLGSAADDALPVEERAARLEDESKTD